MTWMKTMPSDTGGTNFAFTVTFLVQIREVRERSKFTCAIIVIMKFAKLLPIGGRMRPKSSTRPPRRLKISSSRRLSTRTHSEAPHTTHVTLKHTARPGTPQHQLHGESREIVQAADPKTPERFWPRWEWDDGTPLQNDCIGSSCSEAAGTIELEPARRRLFPEENRA